MAQFHKNAAREDYSEKSDRLLVPFAIVHHATPASKTSSSDLPACLSLDLEGILSASAIDSGCNFTTPADATGIFGVLIHQCGQVKKLLKVEMIDLSSGTVALSRKGASSSGVTASGNIAVSADWSGDLSATDLSATIAVDYIIAE